MQKLTIKCTACNTNLCTIEKPIISSEDIQLYTSSVSCPTDGNQSISFEVITE